MAGEAKQVVEKLEEVMLAAMVVPARPTVGSTRPVAGAVEEAAVVTKVVMVVMVVAEAARVAMAVAI